MPARRVALPSTLLAAALVTAAAGCGGGRLSHGDFVRRADAVCSAFRKAAIPIARPRDYAAIVTYVNKTLPLYEAARLKLAALKPPTQDLPIVRTWLVADKNIAVALHDLGEAGLRHDFAGVSVAAGTVQAEGVASRHAAAALGLQVCSTVP